MACTQYQLEVHINLLTIAKLQSCYKFVSFAFEMPNRIATSASRRIVNLRFNELRCINIKINFRHCPYQLTSQLMLDKQIVNNNYNCHLGIIICERQAGKALLAPQKK